MYALVTLWHVPDARSDRPWPDHGQSCMPLFQESPGLIDGYWTFEHSNGKSFGFTLFDTAEHAHELKRAIENFVEEKEEPKVQLEMIRVQEIVARVPARSASIAAS